MKNKTLTRINGLSLVVGTLLVLTGIVAGIAFGKHILIWIGGGIFLGGFIGIMRQVHALESLED